MDSRLQHLSFSSLLTLHTCPRKFQLNRLQSREDDVSDPYNSSVTFAYGHTVGTAVQLYLSEDKDMEVELTKLPPAVSSDITLDTLDVELAPPAKKRGEVVKIKIPEFPNMTKQQKVIWGMYLNWETDLENRFEKHNKSFYSAVAAAQRFFVLRDIVLKGYELVYYNGKPATELGFRIVFPDGFKLRGYVDAVLRHRETGEILVLECKTTKDTEVNPAKFKNSAQALGYSVVLDVLFPGLSSYKVLYLVYKTKAYEWVPLEFTKNYLQRALWIQELLLDIETIKMYEETGVYPMRGENCFDFWRECEYINLCTLNTSLLATPESDTPKEESFDIELTIQDLVQAQLERV